MSESGHSVDVIVNIPAESLEDPLMHPASVRDLPAVGCRDSARNPSAGLVVR